LAVSSGTLARTGGWVRCHDVKQRLYRKIPFMFLYRKKTLGNSISEFAFFVMGVDVEEKAGYTIELQLYLDLTVRCGIAHAWFFKSALILRDLLVN
jgi:hypothetical protein